jgi:hypothetical protein
VYHQLDHYKIKKNQREMSLMALGSLGSLQLFCAIEYIGLYKIS